MTELDCGSRSKEAKTRTHKVKQTEVVMVNCMYAVRFEFDDGQTQTVEVGAKNIAEFYAREQRGQDIVVGISPLFLSAKKIEEIRSRLQFEDWDA